MSDRIAHSRMAAENLEQVAQRLGHDIKVEIQGAMGAADELSAGDIAGADATIIAADTAVNRDRFDDVPLVKGTVKDAVNDVESLIEEAVEIAGGDAGTEAPVETDTDDADDDHDSGSEQVRRGGDREKSLVNRIKRLLN